MYVLADFGHDRRPALARSLRLLWRGLLTAALGALTLLGGVVLGSLPWPSGGGLTSEVVQVLATQAANLGVRLYCCGPGVATSVNAYLLMGLILVMPALLSELLIAAWPKLVRRKPAAAVLAVSAMWLAFLAGIVLGYTLAVPSAVSWTAKGAAGVTLPSSSAMTFIFAPVYIDAVSNLLISIGLFAELPVAMYALAKLGAIPRVRMAPWRLAAIPLAGVLAVLLVGTHDLVNVGLAAVGAYLPFELGLFLARFAQPSTHEPVSA